MPLKTKWPNVEVKTQEYMVKNFLNLVRARVLLR